MAVTSKHLMGSISHGDQYALEHFQIQILSALHAWVTICLVWFWGILFFGSLANSMSESANLIMIVLSFYSVLNFHFYWVSCCVSCHVYASCILGIIRS